MIFILLYLMSTIITPVCIQQAKEKKSGGSAKNEALAKGQDTIFLLDRKSLSDFAGVKENWYLEDGMLVGSTMNGILDESSWITTKEEYGDFEMLMEVKLLGDENRNSGIYYRGVWKEKFVVGYEFDIGGWGEDDNEVWWGELHDPYRRELKVGLSQEKITAIYKPEQWNHVRIRAEGDRIKHWLNGALTVDWRETDLSIKKSGFIAFQMHGQTAFQVFFKNIKLIPLR